MKNLRYFVDNFEAIRLNAVRGIASLFSARDALNALEKEFESQCAPAKPVLADLTEPNQVKRWTDHTGKAIEVGAMGDARLFYALAKAGRGEYPDSYSRQTGVRALKIEAFRRLRNELTKSAGTPLSAFSNPIVDSAAKAHFSNPPKSFECSFCTGYEAHRNWCPTLSNT